jgi:hypothetical protein
LERGAQTLDSTSEQVGGHLRDSVAAGVVVRRNRFESNTLAVQATGAALEYSRLWGRSPTNVQAAAAILSGTRFAMSSSNTTRFVPTGQRAW